MDKIISRKNCVNCHFFVKTVYPDRSQPATLEIKQNERDLISKNDFNWKKDYCSLGCAHLVWDEGHNLSASLFEVITKTKRNNCFFWKFHPGMLLPAAKELQKRDRENQKLKTTLFYTRLGLCIAAAALVADIILKVVNSITK